MEQRSSSSGAAELANPQDKVHDEETDFAYNVVHWTDYFECSVVAC